MSSHITGRITKVRSDFDFEAYETRNALGKAEEHVSMVSDTVYLTLAITAADLAHIRTDRTVTIQQEK